MRETQFLRLDDIALDPLNPRLGRAAHEEILSQEQLLDRMKDWSLEELATSFLESGFWPHEAVLCVREQLGGEDRLIVIEGNRRIAALLRLRQAYDGNETSPRWRDLIEGTSPRTDLFDEIPAIVYDNRSEVDSFLGFRHVTGIKEWAPPEKAQFIAKLIDDGGLDYRQVMRRIGSKTETVERNYVSYCILRQMEDIEGIDVEQVEGRFSVLFLSLRSKSVQGFLGIESKFGSDPKLVYPPIAIGHLESLKYFTKWLFGDAESAPIVADSRQIDRFARVLSSEDAVNYLKTFKRPSLEVAFQISGGDQEELIDLLSTAAYSMQEALSTLHLYKTDERLIRIAKRLLENAEQVRKTLELE